MYALEHYEEIDDIYRKKQKKQLGLFFASTVLTLLFGATSVWGYLSAESKKSENYNVILKTATTTEDYYQAILTDPTKVDAFIKLNDYLTNDFELSQEEGQQLLKLQTGLDEKKANGFSQNVDVLNKLKSENPKGYMDVCYDIGQSFLFYYDAHIDRDRYSNAAKWFEDAKGEYEIASIYCDIANCLEFINQYNGSKIKQTEKMYEEYSNLWNKIKELKIKSDSFEGVDSKLQVWNEINNMINTNVAPFLEVVSQQELIDLLKEIQENANGVTISVLHEDITLIQNSISETIKKIDSAQ